MLVWKMGPLDLSPAGGGGAVCVLLACVIEDCVILCVSGG